MRTNRRLLATTGITALIVAGGAAAAPAANAEPVYDTNGPAVTVYNTPGGQIVNGRLWNTTCAKYSSSTVRCTTNIWATRITYTSGKFTTTTGWVFNNLTYLPSTRTAWKKNPLGAYGVFKGTATWTTAGRKWRTECDTPATGTGACRSYIWSTYPKYSGGKYSQASGWVFNNQVLFSNPKLKAVTTVPAHVLDRARLTPTGWGPLQRNAKLGELQRLGYARLVGSDCKFFESTAQIKNRGVRLGEYYDGAATSLNGFSVESNYARTAKGARVGMTIAQVRALHPELKIVGKKDLYGTSQLFFATLRDGASELIFYVSERNSSSILYPSEALKVRSIQITNYSDVWGGDGC